MGTGWPVSPLVARFGAPAEDGSPKKVRGHELGGEGVLPSWCSPVLDRQRDLVAAKRRGVTGRGDRVSWPAGGRTFWSASGGWYAQKARGHKVGGWGVHAQLVVSLFCLA